MDDCSVVCCSPILYFIALRSGVAQAVPVRYTQPLELPRIKLLRWRQAKNLPRDPRPLAPSQFCALNSDAATVCLSCNSSHRQILSVTGTRKPAVSFIYMHRIGSATLIAEFLQLYNPSSPNDTCPWASERARKVRAPSRSSTMHQRHRQ